MRDPHRLWENWEITKEPLKVIATNDPVTCAICAREKGLLDKTGQKWFWHIAKNEKKFTIWSTKLNLSHLILHLGINMVMKFLGLMNKLNNLTRKMVIPYGETQQH
jgi:hypothetical protein